MYIDNFINTSAVYFYDTSLLVKDNIFFHKFENSMKDFLISNESTKKIHLFFNMTKSQEKDMGEYGLSSECGWAILHVFDALSELIKDIKQNNEIRNADNPALPAIHSFERWKFVEYTPVQGRIKILNPSGIREEGYDYIRTKKEDSFYNKERMTVIIHIYRQNKKSESFKFSIFDPLIKRLSEYFKIKVDGSKLMCFSLSGRNDWFNNIYYMTPLNNNQFLTKQFGLTQGIDLNRNVYDCKIYTTKMYEKASQYFILYKDSCSIITHV